MRRIRKAREQKGLTREQLGERIGVSPSAIGKWETGDRTPSSDTLARLSEELGVSTDYLLELDNPSKDSEGARRIIDIAADDPKSDALSPTIPASSRRLTSTAPRLPQKGYPL